MSRVVILFFLAIVLFGAAHKAPLLFCSIIGIGFILCLIHFIVEVWKNK